MAIVETRIRSARRAVAIVFALHGASAGTFFTRIPWMRDHLGLSPGALGIAMMFPAAGACATMPLVSRIRHRFGDRGTVRMLLVFTSVGLALPAFAPNLPVFCVALLLAGVAAGTTDVAMNANAVAVEEQVGRSIMSGLHGTWSVGSLGASGIGALAAQADVDGRLHLGVVAVLLTGAGLLASGRVLDARPKPTAAAPPLFALPGRALLPIGLVGFCAIYAEGATSGWSGIYLRDVASGSAGLAAASFSAFAATMAVVRLSGDLAVRRFGPVATVRVSGAVAVLGGLLVVGARSPVPAITGFALIGIGVAVVVPLAIAAAGRSSGDPGRAIAGMGTLTYAAALGSPAATGLIAGTVGLPASFGLITVLVAIMLLRAGVLAPAAPAATPLPVPEPAGLAD
ncbi:MAG TPA: MFS transporter [Mycobacteriales bacterium]|nr:MFS transporter [Mycobacteriales bacterium]